MLKAMCGVRRAVVWIRWFDDGMCAKGTLSLLTCEPLPVHLSWGAHIGQMCWEGWLCPWGLLVMYWGKWAAPMQ